MYIVKATDQPDENQEMNIIHGDPLNPDILGASVGLTQYSNKKADKIAAPWNDEGELSYQHLAAVCHRGTQQVTEESLNRIIYADKEVQALHQSINHVSSKMPSFQRVLDDIHGGESIERVVRELECEGILNVTSFGPNPRDLVGNCKVVLTQSSSEGFRFRRIYLVQSGHETKKVTSEQSSDRTQTTGNKITETVAQYGGAGNTVHNTRERLTENTVNVIQKHEINVLCERETVSFLEVVSVEEQVVQVFVEQVPPPNEPLPPNDGTAPCPPRIVIVSHQFVQRAAKVAEPVCHSRSHPRPFQP